MKIIAYLTCKNFIFSKKILVNCSLKIYCQFWVHFLGRKNFMEFGFLGSYFTWETRKKNSEKLANFGIFDQYLTWGIKKYLFNFCKNSEFGNLNWWTNSRAFRGFQFFLQYCCRGKGMKWEINWWKFEESELSELFTKILKISAYFCWEIFIFSKKLYSRRSPKKGVGFFVHF